MLFYAYFLNQSRLMASASYHGDYIPFCAQELFILFLKQLWFFYSYLFREKKYLKCEFTLPSLLEWALLFLPLCLKNSFHIFEILHNKQSIMIHLSLTASLIMGYSSFSFCIFASYFIPRKQSVPHLWIAFCSTCCILYLINTGNLLDCVSNSIKIISVIIF